jgi:hypothetical protein
MKTNSATTSIMDRNSMLDKIEAVRKTVKGRVPNVYLLHGDLEDEDMNDLYNHSKVKAMLSFTKGEGFGRPLLEFSVVEKPVIASGWSGHVDFLNSELSLLVGGELKPIHSSAQNKGKISKIDLAVWSDKDHPLVGTLPESDENLADDRIDSIKNAIRKNYGRYERVKSYNMSGNASWLGQNFHSDEAKLDAVFLKNERGALAREDFNIIKKEGAPSRAVVIFKIKE